MKIICTQENLQRYLSFMDRVIVKQASLPILGNILFQVEAGRVKLSATNLEIGVTGYLGAKVLEDGLIALPARIIGNFVSNLPVGDVVEISTEDKKVFLSSGKHTLSIFGVDGKEFPLIPKLSFEKAYTLHGEQFKTALQKVFYAVSVNTIRPELTGVYCKLTDGVLKLVATDSFRLVEESVFGVQGDGEEEDMTQGIIVPLSTLQEVARIITPETKELQLVTHENQIFFNIEGVEVTSRLINGKFPDYEQIIPTSFSDSLEFQKSDLQRALKISAGLSSYTSGEVALICDKEKQEIRLVSRSHDVGENVNAISFENLQGEKICTFLFQARFLQEYLGSIASDIVRFSYNSEQTPVLFEEHGEVSGRSIIMPIRK